MKKTAKRSAALSLGAVAATLGIAGVNNLFVLNNTYADGNQVTIQDQALFNCLKNKDNVTLNPTGTKYQLEVVSESDRILDYSSIVATTPAPYITINCENKGIKNIQGLGDFPENVIDFILTDNDITDISPLRNRSFFQLYLSDNNISDLSPLSNTTELTYFTIANNSISSLSALSNVTNMISIDASDNQLTSLSGIENTDLLEFVNVNNNYISDISALDGAENLKEFNASNNQITSIEALGDSVHLETVNINDNLVSDISPVANAESLKYFYASNNSISNINALSNKPTLFNVTFDGNKNISDISPLAGSPSLYYVYMNDNRISDISALEGKTKLIGVHFSNNQISDISPISSVIGLKDLNLLYNNLDAGAVDVLEDLTTLETLNVGHNNIGTLDYVSNLPNLVTFYTQFNNISDYSALENNSTILNLSIAGNNNSDISFLESMLQLRTLNVGALNLNDSAYDVLTKLGNLTSLWLYQNHFTTINPLSRLTALEAIRIEENNISDLSGVAPVLTYEGDRPDYVYAQELSMDAGSKKEIELPAIFGQILNSSRAEYIYVDVDNGEYDESTGKVKITDKSKDTVVWLVTSNPNSAINNTAKPYYVKLVVPAYASHGTEPGKDSSGKSAKNPNTASGISLAASIFGGIVAAAGAVFAVCRSRR